MSTTEPLRTNSSLPISVHDDTHSVYVSVTEHYEITDPDLPYEDRFRTDHYTINVTVCDAGNQDEIVRATIPISGLDLLDIAQGFLSAGIAAIDHDC